MIANISVLGGRGKISDAGRLIEGPYIVQRESLGFQIIRRSVDSLKAFLEASFNLRQIGSFILLYQL